MKKVFIIFFIGVIFCPQNTQAQAMTMREQFREGYLWAQEDFRRGSSGEDSYDDRYRRDRSMYMPQRRYNNAQWTMRRCRPLYRERRRIIIIRRIVCPPPYHRHYPRW